MKVIRRKRKVMIQQCAFGQWQRKGGRGSFDCPNCGMTFQEEPRLEAADNKPGSEHGNKTIRLLPIIDRVENEKRMLRLLPAVGNGGSCGEGCAGKCGEKK